MNENKQHQRISDTVFYLLVMLAVAVPIVGYYAYQSFADTTINKTITTNADLESGLIGHWTFDGKDMNWGSTTAEVLDRSGNGNNGNAINLSQSSVGLGNTGQAMTFNGSNNCVRLPDSPSMQITDTYTLTGWFKTNGSVSLTNFERIQGVYTGAAVRDIDLNFWNNDTMTFFDRDSSATQALLTAVTDTSDGMWHFVVGTRSGNTFKLYIDGSEEDSDSISNNANANTEGWRIGCSGSDLVGDNQFFPGMIDDVRVYDHALTAEEIMRLYELGGTTHINTTITTNTDLENGLVGHWTFDGKDMDWSSTTAEILDRSGNGNNGDANFTATSTRPGKIGQGIEFDGIDDSVAVPESASLYIGTSGSVALWTKKTGTPEVFPFLYLNGIGTISHAIRGNIDGTQMRWVCYTDLGATVFDLGNANAPITDNEWEQWVGTYDGVTARFYKNGHEVESSPDTQSCDVTSLGDIAIGGNGGGGQSWNGPIDDVRVYDHALTAEEIMRLYELGGTTHINTTITTNTDLENGLVGHWTFDGKDMDWSSTTAEILDRSGNGNNGDANFTATSTRPGKIGQGIEFDGADDVIDTGIDTSIGVITIAAWIKPNSLGGGSLGRILDKRDSGGTESLLFYLNSGNELFFQRNWSSADGRWATPNNSIQFNEWQHVVVVYSDSNTANVPAFYVNGIATTTEVVSTPTGGSSPTNNSENFRIGNRGDQLRAFDGVLDDVRVYNRALSAEEVSRLYELGK